MPGFFCVPAGFALVGLPDNLQQFVLKCGQFEEVVFFAYRFRRAAAVGAGCAGACFDVKLVKNAVLTRIRALIEITALFQYIPQFGHTALVALFRGADVVVVGQAHPVPQAAELGRNAIGKCLRFFTRKRRGPLDLLPMLVGSGQEPDVLPLRAAAACDGVGHHGRICVADVWPRVDVVDRCRDVERCAGLRHDRGLRVGGLHRAQWS